MLRHFVMAFATCVPTVLDKRRSLPVDAMISDPIFTSTHGITINAPPAGHRRIFIERAYAVLARLPHPLLIGFAAIGHRIMEARHLRGITPDGTLMSILHWGSRVELMEVIAMAGQG
jgi:hypothetical protein